MVRQFCDGLNSRGLGVAFRLVGMSETVCGRTVAESQAERSEIVLPADSNALGNLFGGRLMQYIDLVGAMAASRHARAIVVTASMDHLDFVAPVRVGEPPAAAAPQPPDRARRVRRCRE